MADVLGRGLAAALVASMVRVSVFASAENQEGPATIIGYLNATLYKEASGQFATAVYLSLNRDSGHWNVQRSAAGHPPPLLWRHRKQRLQALDTPGLLLGVRSGEIFSESIFNFEAGDRLLVYSDGLTEAENKAGAALEMANSLCCSQKSRYFRSSSLLRRCWNRCWHGRLMIQSQVSPTI